MALRYFWPIGTLPGKDVSMVALTVRDAQGKEHVEPRPEIVNGYLELRTGGAEPMDMRFRFEADGTQRVLYGDASHVVFRDEGQEVT